jgi:threonine/homoserine/homoserine lactone efflux protein
MKSLTEGIQTGLIICFLIGPIFFTLLQTAVERGFRAGAMVGLGIWMSDMLFITAFYSGVSQLDQLMRGEESSFYVVIIGSLILAAFGVSALFTKPALASRSELHLRPSSSYLSLWIKGFFLNVVNPPTTLFWFTIVSTTVVNKGVAFTNQQALLFFGGIMGTVISTDLLKILLAKRIRHWLSPVHILWFRRISGIALIIFGIVLIVRRIYFPDFMNGH